MNTKKPLILVVMDGYGLSNQHIGNSIYNAKTPNLDKYFQSYPNTTLKCSGLAVGLPEGQMGNSEVGHTNMGAGRVVYQELTRISKEISDGSFFRNTILKDTIDNCKHNQSSLHIMGLLSDGGVHSHIEHLYALLGLAKNGGLEQVYIHCFMDGRDTPPDSGINFIKSLEGKIEELGIGQIVTVMGRYYAMDRDNRWDRVKKAYDAMVNGIGSRFESAIGAVKNSYENGVTDEFILPSLVFDKKIRENDSIIFYNFRPDRAREITRTLVDKDFHNFEREYMPLFYVCFTEYDASIKDVQIAFKSEQFTNTFGEYISKNGLTQLRISETEKYAHVTFFFNGGIESVCKNEDRILVKSPSVATYDMKPEMSAYEVTEKVVEAIKSNKYDFILLNYANCDMVGHTGDYNAAVKAVETVDICLERVVDAIIKNSGVVLITADHGNAETMIENNQPMTAHTTNEVPFIVVNYNQEINLKSGKLCDISPTMLKILNLEQPKEMLGESLI